MDPTNAERGPQDGLISSDILHKAALCEILERGAPILGPLEDCLNSGKLSDWMSAFPDQTELVLMNLPGTHDTCTWNYTPEVQKSLMRYTGPIHDSRAYRCQGSSIFKMLNDGIRVLDLCYAWNPDLETIGFYHSKALLSPTTRMEDVFFGLYHWLSLHPSETILVSMNYEPGTGAPNDARLQETLYTILTSKLAKSQWSQTKGDLGTLGENRGKLILIQRFDFDLLPSQMDERIGIHLNPGQWTVNGQDITINYAEGKTAYIQDYYKIDVSPSREHYAEWCIEQKFKALTNHLEKAIDPALHPDQLNINFASASCRIEEPSLTPEVYAQGDGKGFQGLNWRLLSWLKDHEGKRYGIILLDFYESEPQLVEAIIGDLEKIPLRN